MVLDRFLRFLAVFLLFTSFFSLSFAAFPQFEFTETSYPSGPVDVEVEASSGSQVEFTANGDFVGRIDVVADPVIISLTGTLEDVSVPAGATLTFRNDNTLGKQYELNVSGEPIKFLDFFGDIATYTFEDVGDILIRDEKDGIAKTISVIDQKESITFVDAEVYMIDGVNDFRFKQRYPLSTKASLVEYNYSVSYEKYSNSISVSSYTNVSNERRINVQGSVSDSSSPLYYVLNNPGTIANPGVLIPVTLDGNDFNFNITSGLSEGDNELRLISTEAGNINLFNGEERLDIIIDTLRPTIEIENDFRIYTNEPNLGLNISTDGVRLDYEYNGEELMDVVVNGTVFITLKLVDGQNNLTLTVTDVAGNIAKESHNIFFNDEDPELIEDSLEPQELFDKRTARFFFQKIEGKTNKPNVRVTVFTFVEGSKDSDGNPVTCEKFEPLFIRHLGQLDDRFDDDEYGTNFNETQVSLLGLVHKKEQFTTGSNGEFDVIISLQEKNFDERDVDEYDDAYDEYGEYTGRTIDVERVTSKNTICFIMEDEYGNVEVDPYQVTLDAGNTFWKPGEITTIPNTVYAAEIEQTGDVRSGRGQAEFGMIANFQYIGPGKIQHIRRPNIRVDTKGAADSKHVTVDMSRMSARLDKSTGDMLVYVPVKLKKLNERPIDYPDKFDLAFSMSVSYELEDGDGIPIDRKNPVYFQTSINIERPLDHTKWLTPEMIDKGLELLNKTLNITEKLVDFTGQAAVAGVLACTGAKFWYGMELAQIEAQYGDDEVKAAQAKEEAKTNLLRLCDRVACTESPQKCEQTDPGDTSDWFKPGGSRSFEEGSLRGVDGTNVVLDDGSSRVLAEYDDLRLGTYCKFGVDPDGNPVHGVTIDGDVTEYDHEVRGGFWRSSEPTQARTRVTKTCVEAEYPCADAGWKPGDACESGIVDTTDVPVAVDLKQATGVCYSPGDPNYDDTRCWLPGQQEGTPGKNHADNIIESVQCGCITSTHSHIKQIHKVMEGIEGCLQQAKVGDVKGSYCERLLSQAVCDVATNVVFKTLGDSSSRANSAGNIEARDDASVLSRSLGGLAEGDKELNERYRDTFLSQAGLSTYQVVNKGCVAAISGDFSILTDNILGAIDQNEIEPIFGPAFPESRLMGYNPLTGDLSVQYRFSYGVVSGGQHIRTKVKFICDKSRGGEYCPDTYVESDNPGTGSDINIRTLTVSAGEAKADTVVAVDSRAKYRYNILRLEHTYRVNGKEETYIQEENIFQKGEFLFANCHFSAGALGAGSGIRCDTLFTDDSLLSIYRIDESATRIVPENYVFYEGNYLSVDLAFDVRFNDYDNEQQKFDLVYYTSCPSIAKGKTTERLDVHKIDLNKVDENTGEQTNLGSRIVKSLFNFETIGLGQNIIKDDYYTDILEDQTWDLGGLDSLRTFLDQEQETGRTTVTLEIENIGVGNDAQNIAFAIDRGSSFGIDFDASDLSEVETTIEPGEVKKAEIRLDTERLVQVKFKEGVPTEQVRVRVVIKSDKSTNSKNFLLEPRLIESETSEEFDLIKQGVCTLKLRVVPDGEGERAAQSAEAFETYKPFGDGDDIQTFGVESSSNVYEGTYIVGKKDKNDAQDIGVEVVRPYEDQIVCLENGQIKAEIIHMNSLGSGDLEELDAQLKLYVSVEGYDINVGGDLEAKADQFGFSEVEKTTYSLPIRNLDALEKVGSSTPIPATLTYSVNHKKNPGEDAERVTTKEKRINFRIATNC